jgi:23S rRNA (pseudouridine1915-N3)-methyltransferase
VVIKIKVITIGKDKDPWVSDGCQHFLKLLRKYADVQMILLPSLKGASSLPPAEIKAREAQAMEPQLARGMVVALVDTGKRFDSPAFAKQLERWQATCDGQILFLIGGAYGLHERLLARADHLLSLSPLTFSHQLVRVVLLEQLYRAFAILGGSPYHK